jgi:anti-anti-sigma regulatory factor
MFRPIVILIWGSVEVPPTIRSRLIGGGETAAVRETILRSGSNLELLKVNVRDVEKLDAADLSALVFAYFTARPVGARYRLAAEPPPIRKVLKITCLDKSLLHPVEIVSMEAHR